MADKGVCVVIGVGPGNGEALVRNFAEGGYQVAAMSRTKSKLDDLVGQLDNVHTYACDASDAESIGRALSAVEKDLGPVDTVLYNAGSGTFGTLMEVDANALTQSWQVNTLGLFHVARHVLPAMVERGRGTIGITGATASLRGKPFTTAFAQAKAAQRSLAQSLAREFGSKGVHVFYVIVDGMIDLATTRERMPNVPAEKFLKPDDMAAAYWHLAHQPPSAWTFELDLRPHVESW